MEEKYFITDVSLKAIVEKDGRILLTLDHNGMWELPGGRMNEGETPEEGLKREMKEELDLDVEPFAVYDAFNFMSNSGKNHFVVTYFCKVKNIAELKIKDGEVKDLKWTGGGDFELLPMRDWYKNILRKFFKDYAK